MLQDQIKEIREVLKEVKYPGTAKNIVELDMVQHIRIDGDKIMFRLVFRIQMILLLVRQKECRLYWLIIRK